MRQVLLAACAMLLAGAGPDGIALTGPAGSRTLDAAALAALPSAHVDIAFASEHGAFKAGFDGPLLWTVLTQSGAVDPAKPQDMVREAVLLTGSDGYTAVLALGEIAPAFENKTVLLADSMDGKPLGPGHWRIVVPGEKRGGRSVRDITTIAVIAPK